MNKWLAFFIIGLCMFLVGISLSIKWATIGSIVGIGGGIIMGSSTYFINKK